MSEDIVDRIRLARSPGIGPITFRQLLQRFGSAGAALAALPDLARRGGGPAPRILARDEAERELAKVERLGARYLVLGQGLYPRLLAELEDSPPLLIARGELKLLDRPAWRWSERACGPRRMPLRPRAGERSGPRGGRGFSGLARGIDSAAHDGAMDSARSVRRGGIDIFYPPENERAAANVRRRLVVSGGSGARAARSRFSAAQPDHCWIVIGYVGSKPPPLGPLITARLAARRGAR